MKSKLNPLSVGSFVIGIILLIIVGLISFKSIAFINKPVRFVSYFDESVQGLDIGSSVKLRGVTVGRVVGIRVNYDWKNSRSDIAVTCEMDRKSMTDRSGAFIPIANHGTLEKLIEEGLRAKIDLVGITGMQFVQLDFMNPQKHPAELPDVASTCTVIPVVDSGMSKLTDNLVKISENMSKMDLEGMSKTWIALLTTLNDKAEELNLQDLDLQRMTEKFTLAAIAIRRLADYLRCNPSSVIFGRKPRVKKGDKKCWLF